MTLVKDKKRGKKLIAFGWYGGKYNHLDWLLPLLPKTQHYCEPVGGSAAVLREKVNVADASSGMVADIECWLNGEIALLVEVKDRSLTLTQLNAKIDITRSNQIKEILFMAQQGIDESKKNEIHKKISQEFTSGQNIYVSNFFDFAKGILIILGEKGRVDFISKIGSELDRSKSSIKHKKAWANLLKEI